MVPFKCNIIHYGILFYGFLNLYNYSKEIKNNDDEELEDDNKALQKNDDIAFTLWLLLPMLY